MSETEIEFPVIDTVSSFPDETGENGTAGDRDTAATRASSMTLIQRIFSFPAMLGALLVAGMATIARTFFIDPDVWWHIKFGQAILATHHWPTNDIYSFSAAGRQWIDSEWIGEVLLATVYRMGGMRGLEILLLVLGSAILNRALRSGNDPLREILRRDSLATAAVFILATPSFNLRPQMLGYLFLILTLIALERFRLGSSPLGAWTLPILTVIWVNTHPSWTIGLGMIGVYLACGLVEFHAGDVEARRWSPFDRLQLASVLVLCGCVTLITPYGTGLARFPFEFASSLPVSLANIKEWLPMAFGAPLGKIFLIAVFGVIVLQLTNRLRWRLEDVALFIFATAVACVHRRFLLIFVPILTLILATTVANWVPRYQRAKDQFHINAGLMAAILAIIIWYFPSQNNLWQVVGKDYPVAAVQYLDNHAVPGPMYNTYDFGGYLILSRGPENKVFLDGRSELYEPAGVLANYFASAYVEPGALSMLRTYGIQSCLLQHDEALATVLMALPEWQKVYQDGTSILFVRRNDPSVPEDQSSGSSQLSLRQE